MKYTLIKIDKLIDLYPNLDISNFFDITNFLNHFSIYRIIFETNLSIIDSTLQSLKDEISSEECVIIYLSETEQSDRIFCNIIEMPYNQFIKLFKGYFKLLAFT